MTYELNWTDQTFGSFFSQIGTQTGFFDMLLFVEFMVIISVGILANKKATGFSNSLDWALLAGFITTMSALMLFMGNLVEMTTLIMCAVVTIGILIVQILEKMMQSRDGV